MAEIAADLAALDSLLAREEAALRAGKLDTVGALAVEKDTLVDRLESANGPVDAGRWQAIRDRAERNGHLIAAARDGVKAAEERVAAIGRARDSLETYDRAGTRRDLGLPRAKHERRA